MSAPDTNVERQEQKHKASLLGIRGAVIFGVVMVLLVIVFSVMNGSEPSEETLIGTGTEQQDTSQGVQVDPAVPGTNESN